MLSKIARNQPQAAYAAFISGFRHKFAYFIRYFPTLQYHLENFDSVVNSEIITAITDGYICTRDEISLLSLPAKKGGLGVPIFLKLAPVEYENSVMVSRHLALNIKDQKTTSDSYNDQIKGIKLQIRKRRFDERKVLLEPLRKIMGKEDLRDNDLAVMKVSSPWLTTLPIESETFFFLFFLFFVFIVSMIQSIHSACVVQTV